MTMRRPQNVNTICRRSPTRCKSIASGIDELVRSRSANDRLRASAAVYALAGPVLAAAYPAIFAAQAGDRARLVAALHAPVVMSSSA